MLVTLNEVLIPAHKNKYAVGAFNVYNLETIQAVIDAAELEKSPAIIQASESAIKFAGFHNLTVLMLEMAERAKVPIVVHLDHGKTLDLIKQCISDGFSSVMVDASTFKENDKIKITKELADLAHKHGIAIESERDSLAGVEDDIVGEANKYTNPDTAEVFCDQTTIDAFAVSIGNAHGVPVPDEKLEFEILKQCSQKIDIPLVLHGASGTPPDQIKTAILNGISKINIDTDLRLSYMATVSHYILNDPDMKNPRKMLDEVKKAMTEVVVAKMRMFGSSGRA